MECKKCLPVVIGDALKSGALVWKAVGRHRSAFDHFYPSLLSGAGLCIVHLQHLMDRAVRHCVPLPDRCFSQQWGGFPLRDGAWALELLKQG